MSDDAAAEMGITEEDRIRANTYRLLGTLLAQPPSQEVIDLLQQIEVDERELTVPWRRRGKR